MFHAVENSCLAIRHSLLRFRFRCFMRLKIHVWHCLRRLPVRLHLPEHEVDGGFDPIQAEGARSIQGPVMHGSFTEAAPQNRLERAVKGRTPKTRKFDTLFQKMEPREVPLKRFGLCRTWTPLRKKAPLKETSRSEVCWI